MSYCEADYDEVTINNFTLLTNKKCSCVEYTISFSSTRTLEAKELAAVIEQLATPSKTVKLRYRR